MDRILSRSELTVKKVQTCQDFEDTVLKKKKRGASKKYLDYVGTYGTASVDAACGDEIYPAFSPQHLL